MKKYIFAILASGLWVNVSEFVRNELVIKDVWVSGFTELGLAFPSAPINGAMWGIWAFVFVGMLTWLCTKFSTLGSTVIAWVVGFVLLWIAMWNMGVLPRGLLFWAVPWSFVEVYVAAVICTKVLGRFDSRSTV